MLASVSESRGGNVVCLLEGGLQLQPDWYARCTASRADPNKIRSACPLGLQASGVRQGLAASLRPSDQRGLMSFSLPAKGYSSLL